MAIVYTLSSNIKDSDINPQSFEALDDANKKAFLQASISEMKAKYIMLGGAPELNIIRHKGRQAIPARHVRKNKGKLD